MFTLVAYGKIITSFDGPPHVTVKQTFITPLPVLKNEKQKQMTVWYHPSTIFKRRHVLRIAGLLTLCVALTTTLLLSVITHAAPGVNQTLSFSGRLLKSSGGVVDDGYYNMQFKIYQDGTGTVADNPGGTLEWTETYINDGGTDGVYVKNGYFSVNLGSENAFGSSVDWNQDTLWLSMNIAGSDSGCTTFGTSPCTADGEMLPMKRLTSTPYALNSGQLGGKSADEFVQLGQGVQTDSTDSSSIFINKTGNGNLLQLQNDGADLLTLTDAGELRMGSGASRSIYVGGAAADTAGNNLTMFAGWGGSGSGANGGSLFLQGGGAGGTNANGGDVVITGGANAGSGEFGDVFIGNGTTRTIQVGDTGLASGTQTINIGNNNTAGGTTNVTIGAGGTATGGSTSVRAKDNITIATNGTTRATFSGSADTVYFGNGVTSASPNNFVIQGTGSSLTSVTGGSLSVQGGDATVGDADGGNLNLTGGTGSGSGVNGLVVLGTPTLSTVTNDANCFTGGALVSSSCTITASSINNSSSVIVGFDTANQTVTVPDPTITTPGRIVYITGSSTSVDFTVSINGGGANNLIDMRADSTASLIWNGSDWVVTGVTGTSAFRDIYDSGNSQHSVQIGDGDDQTGDTTLFTFDKSDSAPTITDDSLLGSMYYDTTLGKLQCYEADGWGACGSAPDVFVTISPEYTNAVMNGTDIGTISSDICSDTLDINDGTSAQPTICGTNETYNFYQWTSGEVTAQTRGIYITYQLPSTFKEFAEGMTSIKGRTDSADANVEYQIYRDDDTGLTACGSAVSVSTGSQSSWQTGTATSGSDPTNCSFEAGDSILIRINLTASDDANAYVSDISFTYSNE